jgi:N-acetylglucosamine-6-sulfatase
LNHLIDGDDPFFLAIMPYAPHAEGRLPPTPQARHAQKFAEAQAPRVANWNPSDEIQQGKSVYIKDMKLMDKETEAGLDRLYQGRVRSLQGIDEIIEDAIQILEEKKELDNTYSEFTVSYAYHSHSNII